MSFGIDIKVSFLVFSGLFRLFFLVRWIVGRWVVLVVDIISGEEASFRAGV